MKKFKKSLALTLVLLLALAMAIPAAAADAEGTDGFGGLPAGTYTYVSGTPAAETGSGAGEVQFDYLNDTLIWAFGGDSVSTGQSVLEGDELKFFQSLYLADRPVTDWVGGGLKDVEGYAGDVAGNVQITITENGKISKLAVTSATTLAMAVVSKDITDSTLTVSGATRGQPKLLQSRITLVGSTNGLYLTAQGDVILDGVSIGHGEDGVGLRSDKIGGDTFIVGTVSVDGTVEWHNKMGVILPLDSRPGTLVTNGQDINMTGGSNIGRVGRDLTISTGENLGGNITIGAAVSTDSTRGGLLPNADTSADGVTINTSGNIIAGLGNVVIGTNTEKAVIIDLIGSIQGADVTIKPSNKGVPGDVTGAIGSISATGSIDIVVGTVNAGGDQENTNSINGFTNWEGTGNSGGAVIGNLTAQNGDISLVTGAVTGTIGVLSAPNGTVTLDVAGADNFKAAAASLTVDGKTAALDGYLINDSHYFTLDSLAAALSDAGILQVDAASFQIGGSSYVKLRDVAAAADFSVTWNGTAKVIVIDTTKGYTP